MDPEGSSEKSPDNSRAEVPDECELVRSYLPLVKAIARKFYAKNKDFVDLDDLIGAGSEGLIVAARHFDPTLGCRFATYASWWIRNRISKQIRDDRWVMHIPDRTYRKLLKLWKATAILRDQTGRDPTPQEVAMAMDEPVRSIEMLIAWSGQEAVSLDMPVGASGTSTLGDFLTTDGRLGGSSPGIAQLEAKELTGAIRSALQQLDRTEQIVLGHRFGLAGDDDAEKMVKEKSWGHQARTALAEGLPLKQVGDLLNLSDERIRQLEVKAIRKLRHPKISRTLRPFVRGCD